MATLNVQAQIRHNAETVQEYFRDLQKWRSAIKRNEATAERADECVKSSAESAPLAANCSTAFSCKSQEGEQERQSRSRCATGTGEAAVLSTCKNKSVLARDRNSIAAYYAAWDRFDVDEELAKLDTEDSKSHTTLRSKESETAPPVEAKMDAKTCSSTTRKQGKGTIRTLVKTREPRDSEGADTGAADSSTASALRRDARPEEVDTVLQALRTQLLKALARNQESLLDYSFHRCRSAVKGFEACLSCLEEQSLHRALSISAKVQPCPPILLQWKKIRSIFHTNLGFSQLCLARSSRGIECALSAQVDWPESPFVLLLQAACNKSDGNYAQAGRQLRELLTRLSNEEPPKPTLGSECNLEAAPGPTTGDLLAKSITALNEGDFSFLSSTVAITCAKAETVAAAFARANSQNGVYRGQLREDVPRAVLSQETFISETQHRGETTGPRRSQHPKIPCLTPDAVSARKEGCTDNTATGVPDFGVTGTQGEKKGVHHRYPTLVSGPCFVLKNQVSAELSETLALRQNYVLAIRRRRQQQVWQLNQKRLRELVNGRQAHERFPQTTTVNELKGDFSAGPRISKTKEDFVESPARSDSKNSRTMGVEASQQNGVTGLTLGCKTARRLQIHVLCDNLNVEDREAQYQVPLNGLLNRERQAECCALNRGGMTCDGEPCGRPTLHADKKEVSSKRWCVASAEASEEQLCPENTSLSHSIEAEEEAEHYRHSLKDRPSDSRDVGPAVAAVPSQSVVTPTVPQSNAAVEVARATCTASSAHRTHTASVSSPRLLPPRTYLSFQQKWYAACDHGVEKECETKLGTATCSKHHSERIVTQQLDTRAPTRESSPHCALCLQNKLTLLYSIAEHQLFHRVFTFSMEPDVLADILKVIAEGLQDTVQSNKEEETTAPGSLKGASLVNTANAAGQPSRSESASTCSASANRRIPLHRAANVPETKRWVSLTWVHNIVVQLSEVPRFWSAVYQFDKHELHLLHYILRCCLQENETFGDELQDPQPTTQAGVGAFQEQAASRVPSENRPVQRSLVGRLCDIRAKLLEVGLQGSF